MKHAPPLENELTARYSLLWFVLSLICLVLYVTSEDLWWNDLMRFKQCIPILYAAEGATGEISKSTCWRALLKSCWITVRTWLIPIQTQKHWEPSDYHSYSPMEISRHLKMIKSYLLSLLVECVVVACWQSICPHQNSPFHLYGQHIIDWKERKANQKKKAKPLS